MGNRAGSQGLIRLGNRIRDYRQEMGLSQERFAEEAGISVNTVSRIEGGQSAMSIEIFIRVVQTLGVDADELLGWANLTAEGDGEREEMFSRIRHLKRSEQALVMQTIGALVDGLHKYR